MYIKQGICFLLGVCFCFCSSVLYAAPVLLTISESENGQTVGWWPNQPGADRAWVDGFTRQGADVLNPADMRDMPRLSPIVYGQKPLSDTNARTMASLFGVQNVLNGNVTWTCAAHETSQSALDAVRCEGTANLMLLFGRNESFEMKFSASAYGDTFETAKSAVRVRLTADVALPVMVKTVVSGDIPKLLDKPVILFEALPDADTLVAIRKQLKRVPGVNDVAERWVSDGILAMEINPETPTMSSEDFDLIIQGFTGQPTENFMIRETRRTLAGVSFEVLKY